MKLHEWVEIDDFMEVFRVADGWVYYYSIVALGQLKTVKATFVPEKPYI